MFPIDEAAAKIATGLAGKRADREQVIQQNRQSGDAQRAYHDELRRHKVPPSLYRFTREQLVGMKFLPA